MYRTADEINLAIKKCIYDLFEVALFDGRITEDEQAILDQVKIDFEKLKFMHLNKTAALFIAAVEFGCIVAKATKNIKLKFLDFAKNMGLSFQIFDDISDSQTKSSDITKNKATAVTILGLEKAKDLASDLQKQALDILKKMPYKTAFLEKLSLMHN